jgi:hypothetical protein
MSKKQKNKVFLLGKLKLMDYLLLMAGVALFALAYLFFPEIVTFGNEQGGYFDLPPREVPARTIQATGNIVSLWQQNEFPHRGRYDPTSEFFIISQNGLVFPVATKAENGSYHFGLRAIDMSNGRIFWETETPEPYVIRIYNNMFFVLSPATIQTSAVTYANAPILNDQELPYCGFWRAAYLSTYQVNTGKPIWGYKYDGVSASGLGFKNNQVFMDDTDDHGESGLVATVEIPSGMILDQACGRISHRQSNPVNGVMRDTEFGRSGSESVSIVRSKDDKDFEYDCKHHSDRYCIATEGNRLEILDKNTQEMLGYVLFEGAELTAYLIDIVVHNQYIMVYLKDSNQLFAFRYP